MIENDYDRVLGKIPFAERMDDMLLSKIIEGSNVLEVGAGTGLLTEKLAKKGCKVVTVDPYFDAPTHRSIADERLHPYPNVRILSQDILTFNESDFDAIVSRFTYHHIIEKLLFLQKCHAMLKGGCSLLIGDEFIPSTPDRKVAVNMFHEYRQKVADLGIMPREEGIREQDLTQNGEYKTTAEVLRQQLEEVGFNTIVSNVVSADFDLDYDLLGYKVFHAVK